MRPLISSSSVTAIAAIEASDAGRKVLLVEKMPYPGGISICSGGNIRVADDADKAFAYLKATSVGPTWRNGC